LHVSYLQLKKYVFTPPALVKKNKMAEIIANKTSCLIKHQRNATNGSTISLSGVNYQLKEI